MINSEFVGDVLVSGAMLGSGLMILYGLYLCAQAITDHICGED